MQEMAYALATAIGVLDGVRESGKIDAVRAARPWWGASGSSSTPASASWRRPARCGPSPPCGTASAPSATASTDPKLRRFRYGVQVNSLGLTEQQPENNVQRIVLEALGVTLSKSARARAMQLPAWNEALGLPRPWDQQWSLRIQQVLAYETDLLEYEDIFEGSNVIEAKTAELIEAAQAELDDVLALGGAFAAIDELKAPAGAQPGRAGAPHRDGRADGRRRERLHRDGAVAADRRRRDEPHHEGRPAASRPSRSPTSRPGGPSATSGA